MYETFFLEKMIEKKRKYKFLKIIEIGTNKLCISYTLPKTDKRSNTCKNTRFY